MKPGWAEPSSGWVVSVYVPGKAGRWHWGHRGGVYSSPTLVCGTTHRRDEELWLVRQFPHRLNDIVELPIWP